MIKNDSYEIIIDGDVDTINNELKQLMKEVYLYNMQKYGNKRMAKNLLMALTFAVLDQNNERIVYD